MTPARQPLWTYKREPAGMGEWCYRIYRNNHYMLYAESESIAMIICNGLNRDEQATRTSPPAPYTVEQIADIDKQVRKAATLARQPHPQRCIHFEYCIFQQRNDHICINDGDCKYYHCPRGCATHTNPPAAEITSCLQCRYYPEYLDEQILFRYPRYKEEIEHKAAKAAREQVLDEATEWLFDQFKQFTNEKYTFGADWLADWWIERVGFLRTPEGRAELESLRAQQAGEP